MAAITPRKPGGKSISPICAQRENEEVGKERVAEEGEEEDVEAEVVEEAKVKEVRDPGKPTEEERERHYKTHVPSRPWCPVCIEAKGVEDPHRRADPNREHDIAEIAMDYKSFGQSTPGEEDKGTAIIIKDRDTKTIYGHLVEEKGLGDGWIVKKIEEDVSSLGYTDIMVKTDGEPAIVQVAKELQKVRTHRTLIEHPPAYDPKSNGAAEKAVDMSMGQMRAIKIGLEKRIKVRIETTWAVLTWITEHACMMLNRYQVGRDGKTPYRRVMGKECDQKTLEFGEQVYAKPKRRPNTTRKLSLESRWKIGTWVGMTNRSNEHIVIIQDKDKQYALRVRTVRRVTEEHRWSAEAIKGIVATVKVPIPGQKHRGEAAAEEEDKAPKVHADLGGDGTKLEEVEVEQKNKPSRDFKITKRILEKYGLSRGCPGCEATLDGKSRVHTQGCRSRIEEAMKADEEDQRTIAKRNVRVPEKELGPGEDESANARSSSSRDHKMVNETPQEDIPEYEPLDDDDKMPELHDETDSEDEGAARPVKRETDKKDDDDKEDVKRRRMAGVAHKRFIYRVASKVREKSGKSQAVGKIQEVMKDLEVNDSFGYIGDKGPSRKPVDVSMIIQAVMEMEECSPHESEESEKRRWRDLYDEVEFYDDVKDAWLDKEEVIKARKLELEFFRKMGVYRKVPVSESRGHKVITTRWVDTNKGDAEKWDYRSRLVGRELKQDNRLDLFAPTPPLEVLKALVSYCAKSQNRSKPMRLATVDIKRAYFYAPACRKLYIRLPPEDQLPGEEGMVGELKLSLYGTRDAAMNWTRQYTNHLKSIGFECGRASACNFVHKKREIKLTCHGDDFVIIAEEENIRWLINEMEKVYELKSTILGPEKHNEKELKILNRTLRWTEEGIQYEGDRRHAEVIIKELGIGDLKPLSSPGAPEIMAEVEKEKEVEDKEDLYRRSREEGPDTLYRALAARINYMAQDRLDLTFASNWSSQFMSQPTPAGWKIIRRIGRYLLGAPRVVQTFHWGDLGDVVEGQGDSDWAGDKVTRRSTSGGILRWNGDVLKGWATRQQTIALSSGEAELYAMTRTASQVIGLIQLLGDFFPKVMKGIVRTDSSAAIGIAARRGLGRTRHIQVQYLWIQEKVANSVIEVKKIGGKENISDILTKHLRKDEIDKIMEAMCMTVLVGSPKNSESNQKLGKSSGKWGGGFPPQIPDLDDPELGYKSKEAQSSNKGMKEVCSMDYWIRTQKERWPGSEVDKTRVDSSWFKISEKDHDTLRMEVLKDSRWLRDHRGGRISLFHPLKHPQGPSQARHVPGIRISSFINNLDKTCEIIIDDWKEGEKKVPEKLQEDLGWTAFVYQIPASLKRM